MQAGEVKELILYDRSRVSLDWKCPRARFWGNEYQGLGIVPARRAIYFDIGDAYHKAVAALKMGGDIEEVVEDNIRPFKLALRDGGMEEWKVMEQATLVEGLIRAYHRHVLPEILSEFRFLSVEEEFLHEHGGCAQMVKPDSLAERLSDDTLWYWEEKTTGSIGEKWFPQWQRAIQLHSTAAAVEAKMGREVQGIIVQGAYKGYEKADASGAKRQTSVLCYGYRRGGALGGPDVGYAWKAGTQRTPVWEIEGGVRRWVANMPPELLSELFARTPPIFLQRRLVEAFYRQQALREETIRDSAEWLREHPEDTEHIMDVVFPQHFQECTPAIGVPCAYADCCFNVHVAEDPLRSGLYTYRDPHHTTDLKGLRRRKELLGDV